MKASTIAATKESAASTPSVPLEGTKNSSARNTQPAKSRSRAQSNKDIGFKVQSSKFIVQRFNLVLRTSNLELFIPPLSRGHDFPALLQHTLRPLWESNPHR